MKVTSLLGLLFLLAVTGVGPATASTSPGGAIRTYDVSVQLRADGSMHVEETVGYDFGRREAHGITRVLRTAIRHDDERDRLYPLTNLEVTSPWGAPLGVDDTESGGVLSIRVGQSDRTVSGRQTYVLKYDVGGVLDTVDGRQVLRRNLVGDGWNVPIDSVTARLSGPSPFLTAVCSAGPTHSCGADASGSGATFAATGLAPGEGLTATVTYPAATFPGAAPIIADRVTLARGFSVTPGPVGLSLLVLLTSVASIAVGLRRVPPVDVAARREDPPPGLRPGLRGILLDEWVDPDDVTATLVDLAVRGHLGIEELPGADGAHGDWRLISLDAADPLERYEDDLLDAIFEGGDEVLVSELARHPRVDLPTMQRWVREAAVTRGWYRRDPARTRSMRAYLGLTLLLVSLGLTLLLSVTTTYGLVGLTGAVASAAFLLLQRRASTRTGTGEAARAGLLAFRRSLGTPEPPGGARFARSLPYAVGFGLAEGWAPALAGFPPSVTGAGGGGAW